jgi:pimeloyl-ACP methyl ester carboxylesterase
MAATGPWLQDIGEAWNRAAAHDGESFYLTTIPIIYSPGFYIERNDWLTKRKEWLTPIFASEDYRSAITRLTDSGVGYDIRERLGEIKAPTLVVSSEHDHLIPIEEQRLLVREIPNSHHVIIADSGHGSMYEKPMVFASLIYGFLNNPTLEYNIK